MGTSQSSQKYVVYDKTLQDRSPKSILRDIDKKIKLFLDNSKYTFSNNEIKVDDNSDSINFFQTFTKKIYRNVHEIEKNKMEKITQSDKYVSFKKKLLKWIGSNILKYYIIYDYFINHHNTSNFANKLDFDNYEKELFCMIVSSCAGKLKFLKRASVNNHILFFKNVDDLKNKYPDKDKGINYSPKFGVHLKRFKDYWAFIIDENHPRQLSIIQFFKNPKYHSNQSANIITRYIKIMPLYPKLCSNNYWKGKIIINGKEKIFISIHDLVDFYQIIMKKWSMVVFSNNNETEESDSNIRTHVFYNNGKTTRLKHTDKEQEHIFIKRNNLLI